MNNLIKIGIFISILIFFIFSGFGEIKNIYNDYYNNTKEGKEKIFNNDVEEIFSHLNKEEVKTEVKENEKPIIENIEENLNFPEITIDNDEIKRKKYLNVLQYNITHMKLPFELNNFLKLYFLKNNKNKTIVDFTRLEELKLLIEDYKSFKVKINNLYLNEKINIINSNYIKILEIYENMIYSAQEKYKVAKLERLELLNKEITEINNSKDDLYIKRQKELFLKKKNSKKNDYYKKHFDKMFDNINKRIYFLSNLNLNVINFMNLKEEDKTQINKVFSDFITKYNEYNTDKIIKNIEKKYLINLYEKDKKYKLIVDNYLENHYKYIDIDKIDKNIIKILNITKNNSFAITNKQEFYIKTDFSLEDLINIEKMLLPYKLGDIKENEDDKSRMVLEEDKYIFRIDVERTIDEKLEKFKE